MGPSIKYVGNMRGPGGEELRFDQKNSKLVKIGQNTYHKVVTEKLLLFLLSSVGSSINNVGERGAEESKFGQKLVNIWSKKFWNKVSMSLMDGPNNTILFFIIFISHKWVAV